MSDAIKKIAAAMHEQLLDDLAFIAREKMARFDYERSVRRRDAMIAYILGEPEPKLPEIRWRPIVPFKIPSEAGK